MNLFKMFVTGLLACFWMGLAQAQPAVGARFEKLLPLGSGASVPLPEGQWEATAVTQTAIPNRLQKWQVTVLKNSDLRSPFAALVVRTTDKTGQWGNTNCDIPKEVELSFLVNRHGTTSNQLLNKCSRFFGYSDGLDPWLGRRKNENSWFWSSDVMAGLSSAPTIKNRNFIVGQFAVQQYGGLPSSTPNDVSP